MAYTNLFRKLANAWGIKTEANTEYGALEAIAENPPFGTKTEMVEIVPEQRVTSQSTNEDTGVVMASTSSREALPPIRLKENTKYIVKFNGVEYICNSKAINYPEYNGSEVFIGADNTGNPDDFTVCPFILVTTYVGGEFNNATLAWLGVPPAEKPLGETITLAIYEEQEVVKQLDPKFVGGASAGGSGVETVFVHFIANDDLDKATTNTTIDEVFEMVQNGKNVVAVVKYPNNSVWYYPLSHIDFDGYMVEFTTSSIGIDNYIQLDTLRYSKLSGAILISITPGFA